MSDLLKERTFWNTTANEYSRGRTKGRKYILDPKLFEIIGNVKNKKILDIACGAGDITIPLSKNGAVCTGIDFADSLIQTAIQNTKKNNLKIKFLVMDARNILDLNDTFDIIVVALLLPHLSKMEDISTVITNAGTLLKPQGRLIIGEPHPTFDFYMRQKITAGDYNYFASGLPYEFTMKINKDLLTSEAYHWTIEDYSTAITRAGLYIKHIVEPKPLNEGKRSDERWFIERNKYPSYIIFDCIKP